MKYRTQILAGAIAALFSSPAAAGFITFDELPVLTVVTNQYANLGVTFSYVGAPNLAGPPIPPETINPNGLGIAGNLISAQEVTGTVAEGGYANDWAYDIGLAFAVPIQFFSIYVLDAEEGFSVVAYLGDTLVATATSTPVESITGSLVNGPAFFSTIQGTSFNRVVLDVTNAPASGAGGPERFDNVCFGASAACDLTLNVPEPGSLVLLAVAASGVLLARRRRR